MRVAFPVCFSFWSLLTPVRSQERGAHCMSPHPPSPTLALFTVNLMVCDLGEPSLLIRANFCCQETPFGPFQLRPAPFKHHPSKKADGSPPLFFFFALKKDPGSLKGGKKNRTAPLSHSRCIQCLALSIALKCKTDGGANKDQREQPCPPGLLSSHARRCCHSESRPRKLPRPRRSSPLGGPSMTLTPLCQCPAKNASRLKKKKNCLESQ